jgi:hypothetical protein
VAGVSELAIAIALKRSAIAITLKRLAIAIAMSQTLPLLVTRDLLKTTEQTSVVKPSSRSCSTYSISR